MTAQVSDRVHLYDETYDVISADGEGLFAPLAHGIRLDPLHSGCWRGYECDYALVEGALRLRGVVFGSRTPPPAVLGVQPTAEPYGGWRLSGLSAPMCFSGELLVGRDFIQALYSHMGAPPAWKYAVVHSLRFEGGRLLGRHDLSAVMAAERARQGGGE